MTPLKLEFVKKNAQLPIFHPIQVCLPADFGSAYNTDSEFCE
jgi:hypothetical protein